MSNVPASFTGHIASPKVDKTAYVHPLASVIGSVELGRRVMVSPAASIRGDEGTPIVLDDDANVQDGVVLHALETEEGGHPVENNLITLNEKKYAVFIGKRVSLAHQAQVHGPAAVEDDTFIGMQALVFKAIVGKGCVIEPGAKVVGRTGIIKIPDHRYVKVGQTVTTQAEADNLPKVDPSYPLACLNKGVVHVNTQLSDGYNHTRLGAPMPKKEEHH
ncbi:MAG: carbonic anhydrase [Deltaproteobacteria bacterium]|nr:carbonic anhydrase [Deltaproteobacteria bacterium]MBW1835113.1 carbonic anhydrase [Deltaproteobacteria bacterium]MBW2166927.1 carbonic anhydrase [Deltaproteobacteria bacterium]